MLKHTNYKQNFSNNLSDFSPSHSNKYLKDQNILASKEKEEKSIKGFERYRTNSFIQKLGYYKNKFKFSEKELLMIKKRCFYQNTLIFYLYINEISL